MSTTVPIPAESASPALPPAPGSPRKPALPALSGVRTLLAISIMLFHFTPPHTEWLRPLLDNSFIFVGCFFLISGFILTYNYGDRALTLVKRDFWFARFARLYPTYLFVLLLSLPMLAGEWQARPHTEFWQGLILTPLLLQGWSPSLATFWNTVAWTLSADVLLYFAFPFLIVLWARNSRWLDRPLRVAAVVLLLWLLGLTPHVLYHFLNPDHLPAEADRYTGAFWMRVLKYTPPVYLCTFLAGVALAKLHALLTLSTRQRLAMSALALTAICLFFYLAAPHIPYVIVHGALLLPLFCLLILGLSGPNLIASAFAMRPLVILGETTFALYLLHFNVFEMIHTYHLVERLHLVALDPWISYVAIIALAYTTVRWIEKPARNLILNHAKRRHQITRKEPDLDPTPIP